MVCLNAMAVLLLVTADSSREVAEAIVMALVFTLFPWALVNAVPSHWVLVGEQGLRLQLKDQGAHRLPWGQISEAHLLKTTMSGPLGPFYADAPQSALSGKDALFEYLQQDHWSIRIISGSRWIHINARDFDAPAEAGRVIGSHLLKAGLLTHQGG